MIGVAVQPAEQAAAAEFFELFKVPWEFCAPDRHYNVLISTTGSLPTDHGNLCLLFGSSFEAFDAEHGVVSQPGPATTLTHGDRRIPLYGRSISFPTNGTNLLRDATTSTPAIWAKRTSERTFVRIGYNLFHEVRHLLTVGQPVENAADPTLDHHAELLRDLITRAGVPVAEIPPSPEGFPFAVCLTHDIDHPVMKNHRLDHTMLGFLYRALASSSMDLCRGRLPLKAVLRNWGAALRLPFVQCGLVSDPWSRFDEYLEIERGLGATYYFIPERDNPGRKNGQSAPAKRASKYTLSELRQQLQAIVAAGNEVGLHGIDSWRDADAARRETNLLTQSAEYSGGGVRMHWLYFDENSPRVLEDAGFSYDSTFGYNATVGYRAGTAQAFRPLGNKRLLELPLHVMDTALFYPSYLHLKEEAAFRLISAMLDRAATAGGVLTFNWHDRSIFPERLWGGFYIRVLDELKNRGAWFPTAAQAVGWFRKRRNAVIESVHVDADKVSVRARSDITDTLPALKIRIHRPCTRGAEEALASGRSAQVVDVPFDKSLEVPLKN